MQLTSTEATRAVYFPASTKVAPTQGGRCCSAPKVWRAVSYVFAILSIPTGFFLTLGAPTSQAAFGYALIFSIGGLSSWKDAKRIHDFGDPQELAALREKAQSMEYPELMKRFTLAQVGRYLLCSEAIEYKALCYFQEQLKGTSDQVARKCSAMRNVVADLFERGYLSHEIFDALQEKDVEKIFQLIPQNIDRIKRQIDFMRPPGSPIVTGANVAFETKAALSAGTKCLILMKRVCRAVCYFFYVASAMTIGKMGIAFYMQAPFPISLGEFILSSFLIATVGQIFREIADRIHDFSNPKERRELLEAARHMTFSELREQFTLSEILEHQILSRSQLQRLFLLHLQSRCVGKSSKEMERVYKLNKKRIREMSERELLPQKITRALQEKNFSEAMGHIRREIDFQQLR